MNTFGHQFRLSIFGESHGAVVGVTVDGVRPGLFLSAGDFEEDLARRRSGALGTTQRSEEDIPEIISGVVDGHTTGAPLTVIFRNRDTRSSDYSNFRHIPRPGHADYTSTIKFGGFNDIGGGGQFSGRMTVALVAAGTLARKMHPDFSISARLVEVGGVKAPCTLTVGQSQTGASDLCATSDQWCLDVIRKAAGAGDSVGGIIECVCHGVPAGVGEPFFDSVESVISHLAFSIPAVRGIEFGDGFRAASMRGSEHNDPIVDVCGTTAKNGAGGVNGGITNGNDIVFRVAVKPTSSISAPQTSYNFGTGRLETFTVKGRHDICIALRCPVIVESVAAIALATLIPESAAPQR